MGYGRGDSFPFNFEPNRNPFGSKSKGKLSPRSYAIQNERKWKHSFLSVRQPQVHGQRYQTNFLTHGITKGSCGRIFNKTASYFLIFYLN